MEQARRVKLALQAPQEPQVRLDLLATQALLVNQRVQVSKALQVRLALQADLVITATQALLDLLDSRALQDLWTGQELQVNQDLLETQVLGHSMNSFFILCTLILNYQVWKLGICFNFVLQILTSLPLDFDTLLFSGATGQAVSPGNTGATGPSGNPGTPGPSGSYKRGTVAGLNSIKRFSL